MREAIVTSHDAGGRAGIPLNIVGGARSSKGSVPLQATRPAATVKISLRQQVPMAAADRLRAATLVIRLFWRHQAGVWRSHSGWASWNCVA